MFCALRICALFWVRASLGAGRAARAALGASRAALGTCRAALCTYRAALGTFPGVPPGRLSEGGGNCFSYYIFIC